MRRRKEIEDPNNTWNMQLMAAVLRRDTDEAEKLLEKGAKIDHVAVPSGGEGGGGGRGALTPFLAAALKGDMATAAWAAANNANAAARLESGATALHHCVHTDDAELLNKLCEAAPTLGPTFSLAMPDSRGMTATELAISLHKPELARVLIKHGARHPFHALVDAQHCQTARACRVGDVAMLQTLLQCGDSPHQRDANGQTLMHLAVQHPPVIAALLECGLSIDVRNAQQQTPLLYAVLHMPRNVDNLDTLLARGADPNLGDGLGVTPLMHTVLAHSAAAFRRLLDAKVDVNMQDAFGATVAHYAVVARQRGALEALLALLPEFNVNATDARGQTALHRAALAGRSDTLGVLITKDAVNVNAADADGNTPLHVAVAADHLECVRALLQRCRDEFIAAHAAPANPKDKKPGGGAGAGGGGGGGGAGAAGKKGAQHGPGDGAPPPTRLNVDLPNAEGLTALQLACQLRRSAAFELLVDAGASIARPSAYGGLLHECVLHGDAALVSLLLARGADVNARNENADLTPLHLAVQCGHGDIAALLVRHGAVIAEQEAVTLRSPLHAACAQGRSDLAQLLLESGPPSLATTSDSCVRTPLHLACARGDEATTRLLLAHDTNGETISATDAAGDTPLHAAVAAGSAPCVRLLHSSGAKLSTPNHRSWTPLHTAIANNAVECVELLLELLHDCCEPQEMLELLAAPDSAKRFPLLLAAEYASPQVAKLLLQARTAALAN